MPKQQKREVFNVPIPETPHRCGCHRLLLTTDKGDGSFLKMTDIGEEGQVHIKCPRCGQMNHFRIHLSDPKNFQDKVLLKKAIDNK